MGSVISLLKTSGSNSPIKVMTIAVVKGNGRHILSDGTEAVALTDERLQEGDRVVVISDPSGDQNILAGAK